MTDITIRIRGTVHGTVLVEVEGEQTQDTRAKRVFDLILPAVRGHFHPKAKRVRRSVEIEQ